MLRAKELGAMINVHAENPDLIDMYTEQFLKEGKTSAWYHYMSRPEFVEAEADKRAVHWSKHLDAPLYLVHMADKEGLEACIRGQRRRSCQVFVETCSAVSGIYHATYTRREDGRNFVCSPPIKGQESQDALWKAIKNGIDRYGSELTTARSRAMRKTGAGMAFTRYPNGCPGVENLYPYMLDAANSGKISFSRAVELCSTNPAKIFGCDQKGSIAVGKDARYCYLRQRQRFHDQC